jgi:uncharacterized membrane protein YkvA (DUF1232 family)
MRPTFRADEIREDRSVRFIVGPLIAIISVWIAFAVALLVIRPRGVNLRDARRIVPDAVRLLRSLHRDRDLPPPVRRWLFALLVYLAIPVDLVPDFVPILGYADDVIVVAFVLRRVVRSAGPAALERHWAGTPAGLDVMKRMAGVAELTNPD